jgi:DUF4097 and DUF4098 domain-containing protein YvlB
MIATGGRATAVLVGLPFVIAAAGWAAFSMVGLLAQTSEHHEATYAWGGGEISMDINSGSVRVAVGTGSQVEVSYTEHYQLKKPTVRETSVEDGVMLSAKCPGGIFSNNCAINYTVTLPASAHLVVHTGDGGITVTGLTGGLSLDTGDGGIALDDVSGTLTAHTGDGGIQATRLSSTTVQASTGDGGIRLEWAVAPTTVTATTGDGGIHLSVPSASGPYRVSATTGDGATAVKVPTDQSAASAITAHTGNGGIVIDSSAPSS